MAALPSLTGAGPPMSSAGLRTIFFAMYSEDRCHERAC